MASRSGGACDLMASIHVKYGDILCHDIKFKMKRHLGRVRDLHVVDLADLAESLYNILKHYIIFYDTSTSPRAGACPVCCGSCGSGRARWCRGRAGTGSQSVRIKYNMMR